MSESFKQIIKYGAVGFIGLGVEWGVFFLVRDVLHLNYLLAHVMGCILAIINNFALNSYFTFKATDKIWKRAASFFAIAGVGLGISILMLPAFVRLINVSLIDTDLLHMSEKVVQNIAKLATTVIIAVIQFIFNKFFTFKKKSV